MKFKYNDYFFYKLVCLTDDIDLSYAGSTTNWRQRKNRHNTAWNNPDDKEYNTKKYQLIRENGGFNNFKMIEIGFRENLTLRQAEAIEEEYRVELRATMNSRKCSSGCQSKQEYDAKYRQEHHQEKVEYNRKYHSEHREEEREYGSKYYQDHKEERNEYSAKHYQENKDAISEKRKVKHVCSICGGKYTITHKAQHTKSKKHELARSSKRSTPSTSTDNNSP